jgi:hypothetical protein
MLLWRYTELRPTVGYGEKVTCKSGSYYRARHKIAPGMYGTVSNLDGSVRKFRRKLDAKRAADTEEAAQAAAQTARAPGRTTRTDPQPCPCHGRTYVFSGTGQARGARKGSPSLRWPARPGSRRRRCQRR